VSGMAQKNEAQKNEAQKNEAKIKLEKSPIYVEAKLPYHQ